MGKKYSPQNDAKWLSDNHDHILIYAKNKKIWRPNLLPRTEEQNNRYKNPDNDPRGNWKSSDLSVKTYSKNNDYPITSPSAKIFNPPKGRCWSVSKTKLDEMIKDKRISFGEKDDGVPRLKSFLTEVKQGTVPLTIWKYKEVGHNQDAVRELKYLFDGYSYFDSPKPTGLINRIMIISTNPNDLILDFFAGSGTTAHAVMQLNAKDKGNRKFILVQWDEEITKEKPAYKFCKENKLEPVISSICIERVDRAGKKILKEQKEKDGMFQREIPLDIGYKVFSLTDKTRVKFDSDEHLFKVEGSRSSHFDTLYNMLAATCKPLDTPVEEIKKGSIYRADNEIYLLGNVTKKEIEEYKDLKVNIDAFADFNLQNYLNLGISGEDNVTVVY